MNTIVPKADRTPVADSRKRARDDPKQRRLMVGSLCLLLLALGIVLWHDRDFWFGGTQQAESDLTVDSPSGATVAPAQPSAAAAKPVTVAKPKRRVTSEVKSPAPQTPPPPVAATTTTRTVLPPLEVEVVAGDTHRVIRPGSSSVRVDLQPGSPPRPTSEAPTTRDVDSAANVTSNAAEHVQMSPDASALVTIPVKPNYPLLARQMKVQGSVILQALIGKDGIIQNLRVVSGPYILASAAQDAVRQWHFKPHFEGAEPVETEAKITVNFTISTN